MKADREPQIWFASNRGDIAGGEVMLFNLAEAARELDYQVGIVAPEQPREVLDRARRAGFRAVGINGRTTAAYLANLRRWDWSERTGWAWANGLRPAVATAGHWRRIVAVHQRPSTKQMPLFRMATPGADRVVVPSASMADALPGTTVLWNWTEPVVARARRPEADRPITIGFLGRLSEDKGVTVLAKAVELLNRTGRSHRLLLAGEPRFVSADVQARVEAALAAIAGQVDRRGWMDRDDFFSEVDLAVFPSVGPETFGLVVAEAMSARCPYVVSDAGALPEVAGPEYPWVAAAGDAAALAARISALVDTMEAGTETCLVDQQELRWRAEFSPEAGRRRLGLLLRDVVGAPA